MESAVKPPSQHLWQPAIEAIEFALGGRGLKTFNVRALKLSTPFTRLSTNLEETVPRWRELPPEFTIAVVPAQPVEPELPRLMSSGNTVRYVMKIAPRYFIRLEGTFEDYLKKFGAKPRHNLTREIRKFAEYSGGTIQCREFLTPDEMVEFRALALEIGGRSWHSTLGEEGFPRSGEFRAEMIDLAARRLARGYVLFHGERPVTFAYCCDQDENLLYARIGYDLDYAKWSPGKVLLYTLVERLFAEKKYRHLDFGDGILPYKSFFATDSTRCAYIIYAKKTIPNLIMLGGHASVNALSVGLGKVMQQAGLKRRIKKLLMGRHARPGQV